MDDTLYTRIKKEQKRITKLYKNLPKDRLEITKKLIERAAYMLVSLEDMEDKIAADGLVVKCRMAPTLSSGRTLFYSNITLWLRTITQR